MVIRKDGRKGDIVALIETEQWAFRERHGKRDFYKYLERVLKVYWKWKDKGVRKTRAAALAEKKGIEQRKGKSSLHILVEATSDQNDRIRSRWIQGLRLAQRRQNRMVIQTDGFESFWGSHGGIAGCAQEFAKSRAAKKKETSVPKALKDDDDWDS